MDDDRRSQSFAWRDGDGDGDEFQSLFHEMNPPRVAVDNESCADATVVRVDSMNKNGILLEVVQVLIDLDLIINKAYISSDGGWFMDVFHVTDKAGKKLRDESMIKQIEDDIRKSLGADSGYEPASRRSVGIAQTSTSYTSIELTGTDRPGFLSEVTKMLVEHGCNVLDAEIWTHNTRAAAVIHIVDDKSGLPITDVERLCEIKMRLLTVLNNGNLIHDAKTVVTTGGTHTERRLHQMMLDDRDYEAAAEQSAAAGSNLRPCVTLSNWKDKDYSVVTIRCKDRPKLLFDTVCTLTDMKFVVSHASIDSEGSRAFQEFYIRHIDGTPVSSDVEAERVIHCLEAAIQRRVSEGLMLEICAADKVGLLSEVTRVFREHSLQVTRAEVTTRNGKAINTFYVRERTGGRITPQIIESVRKGLGWADLRVKGDVGPPKSQQDSVMWFLFGGLFRTKSLYNLGLVR